MDLTYTNAQKIDQGVLRTYAFDLSFGAEENDYEMTLGENEPVLEYGAFVYIEGTEYGGTVDGMGSVTNNAAVTYYGRTWHGVLNSKVIEPDNNEDYYIVSGDVYNISKKLIERLGLTEVFVPDESLHDLTVPTYSFKRYCKAYDGLKDMLVTIGTKLKMAYKNRAVYLYAEPIVDYTNAAIDGDVAVLSVEHHEKKVNHLICLGSGELAQREVIHLYVDQFGKIGDTQYYTGLEEITDIYDYSNAESSDDLRSNGIERLKELRNVDKADVMATETDEPRYDIGDIIGATDVRSGISTAATVTQKIVKITNDLINIEYKTGG